MPDESPSIRDRILASARELFLKKGFNGSNLRDIAREAKVSMGGIYHHFGSKEEIYNALLDNRALAEEFATIYDLSRAEEYPENLAEIGAKIFEVARRHADFFRLCYIDVLEFEGRNVGPVITAVRNSFNQHAENLLKKRLDQGDIVDDVHPTVVARCMVDIFLFSYLEHLMLGGSLAKDLEMSEEELAQQMARMLLHGIMRRD